jgi:hypothetical protein
MKTTTIRDRVHQAYADVRLTPERDAAQRVQRAREAEAHRRWVAEERSRLLARGWTTKEIDEYLGLPSRRECGE